MVNFNMYHFERETTARTPGRPATCASSQVAHGWPVTATGSRPVADLRVYRARKVAWGLPEESPDFSYHDVFDLVEHALSSQERAAGQWRTG